MMLGELPRYSCEIIESLNPIKTVVAVRLRTIPPLICLACQGSGENGKCVKSGVDTEIVKTRWDKQITIDEHFMDQLKPDTLFSEICSEFLPDNYQ